MPLLILPSFVRSSVAGPAFRVCGGLLLVGLFLLLLLVPAARAADSSAATAPAVAFFYGEAPPWEALQAFDIAVESASAGDQRCNALLPLLKPQ